MRIDSSVIAFSLASECNRVSSWGLCVRVCRFRVMDVTSIAVYFLFVGALCVRVCLR